MAFSRDAGDDPARARRGIRRRELLAAVVASAWGGALAYRYLPLGRDERKVPRTAPSPTTSIATTATPMLDVRTVGALGDGRGDDTAAFRRALATSLQVRVPAGAYRVSPGKEGTAIPVTRDSTRLLLEPGASVLLDPSARPGSSIISVNAADVTVEGGTLIGDLAGPQLRAGEWGHGIVVGRGGDRAKLLGIAVVRCWGDGIYLGGGVQDVSVINCAADGNRRQGLSIVSAVRPVVSGGKFVNTGRYGRSLPAAGIDVEPNPLSDEVVVDATIRDVELSGNTGPGLLVVGLGGRATVRVENVVMEDNDGPGATVLGRGAHLSMTGCASRHNHTGYQVRDSSGPTRFADCAANGNAARGFLLEAAGTVLEGCSAAGNSGSGVELAVTARGSTVRRCRVQGNSVSGIPAPEVEVWAPQARLESVTVRAGQPARATSGIWLQPSASGTVVVDTPPPSGFPAGHALIDQRPRNTP